MTCGYICPSCGGNGIDEEGKDCGWCNDPGEKDISEEEQPADT